MRPAIPRVTHKQIWPEDPRWGDSEADERLAEAYRGNWHDPHVPDYIREQKGNIHWFQRKYPEHEWWVPEFVEAYPAVTLVLQVVNKISVDRYIFDNDVASSLYRLVAERHKTLQIPQEAVLYRGGGGANAARLAISSLLAEDSRESLDLMYDVMTTEDKGVAVRIVAGL